MKGSVRRKAALGRSVSNLQTALTPSRKHSRVAKCEIRLGHYTSLQLGTFRKMTLISLHQIKGPRCVLPLDRNRKAQVRPVQEPRIGRRDP